MLMRDRVMLLGQGNVNERQGNVNEGQGNVNEGQANVNEDRVMLMRTGSC